MENISQIPTKAIQIIDSPTTGIKASNSNICHIYASLLDDVSFPRTRIPPTSIRMYARFRAWEIKIFKKLRKF